MFFLVNCPPVTFPNGNFTGSFGQLVFTCDDGYRLTGAMMLTCVPSPHPHWDHDVPVCKSELLDLYLDVWEYVYNYTLEICSNVTVPTHGSCNNGCGGLAGDVVNFNCTPPYVLSGPSQLHCMVNGSWSGAVPRCIGKWI